MAWVEKRGRSFRLILRDHERKLIRYPLDVKDADEAEEIRLRFERRLKLYRAGDVVVPTGVELIPFLIDGKQPIETAPVTPVLTLAQLFRHYHEELSPEAKERQTSTATGSDSIWPSKLFAIVAEGRKRPWTNCGKRPRYAGFRTSFVPTSKP